MASLTPGILEKLLANAGNKEVKVTGEHRSALLQVLEILPSLAGGADDLWKSRGFYLKVSDSRHCAYVSVQDEDMELIYSDKIQLGQFVYVSRLDSGSPVPVLRGLKPVAKRRPCVGNPKDLVSSDVLGSKGNVSFGKGKNGLKKNNVEGLEVRRLSLDSARRIWDQTPAPKDSSGFNSSLKTSSQVNSNQKVASKHDSPLKPPILSISPFKNKNMVSSPKHTPKPMRKDLKSTACSNMPSCLVKVPLSTKTRLEDRISWDKLPRTIQSLGKEIVRHRNVASLAAVTALEEASAAQTVVLCLQAFGELCGSYQKISSGPLVEQYLDLHQNVLRAAAISNSLLRATPIGSKSSLYSHQHLSPNESGTKTNKNAISWVHAAIETNLSKFILFKKPDNTTGDTDPCHSVILKEELNSEKQSPQNHTSLLKNSLATKKNVLKNDVYPKEAGLREAASLAEKLILHYREWFFKYMENSLSNGFRFCVGEDSEIAGLLRQLKRVNKWLDDLDGGDSRRVEDLKKKIYGFLLTHSDSARNK